MGIIKNEMFNNEDVFLGKEIRRSEEYKNNLAKYRTAIKEPVPETKAIKREPAAANKKNESGLNSG